MLREVAHQLNYNIGYHDVAYYPNLNQQYYDAIQREQQNYFVNRNNAKPFLPLEKYNYFHVLMNPPPKPVGKNTAFMDEIIQKFNENNSFPFEYEYKPQHCLYNQLYHEYYQGYNNYYNNYDYMNYYNYDYYDEYNYYNYYDTNYDLNGEIYNYEYNYKNF
jgi:hypothetical protein